MGAIYRAYGVCSKVQLIVRHNELRDQKNLAQNGTDGVNTPLQGARDQLNNPPVARKTNRHKRRT